MLPLLSNRDAVNIAQLTRYLVGVLNTGQAEIINEVRYVDGTNGNNAYDGKSPDRAFKTIAAALAVSAADDVVLVFPGTYAEHLTMAVAGVTLMGIGDTPAAVLLYDTSDVATAMVAITAARCAVRHLRISLGHANNVSGLSITGVSDCLVEDVEFVKGAATMDEGVRLVGPSTAVRNTIRKCVFDTCVLGIKLLADTTNQADVCIEDCLFKTSTTADITDSEDVQVLRITIRRCTFNSIGTDYIMIDAAGGTGIISECSFRSATLSNATVTVAAGIICAAAYTQENGAICTPH